MKKYIKPIPNGGAPLANNRLNNELQDEFWNAIEAIPSGISDPAGSGNTGVIISGCKVTVSSPYSCSAGIVYIAGQYMAFPGFTNQTLPQYILPATLVNIAKVFGDGASKNLITQQDATYQAGVPGVQYIALTTTGNLGGLGGFRIENYATPAIQNTLDGYNFLDSTGNLPIGGATVTIQTIAVPTGKAINVESNLISSVSVGGDCANRKKVIGIKNVAGTLSVIATETSLVSKTTVASAPDLIFTISGTNLLVQAQNTAAVYTVRIRTQYTVSA